VDRKMDGGIGTPWWLGDEHKRNKRIGEQRNGQRAFKMDRVHRVVRRKLRMRSYFEKRIACPAYRFLRPGSAVHLG
jgi:hypothetical protein